MAADMPNDAKAARALLHRVAERMGLEIANAQAPRTHLLIGDVDGTELVSEVRYVEVLGAAYYDVTTTLTIAPSLGMDLSFRTLNQSHWEPARAIPEAWAEACGARALATSVDPAATRAILETVPLPGFLFSGDASLPILESLTDEQVIMSASQLATGSALEAHLRDAAAWTAAVAEAGRRFDPADHPIMRAARWRPVSDRHAGELDLRERRFRCETPSCTLTVDLRWTEEDGYRYAGRLTWPPLPFDELRLTPQAERSWLRRLFLRDIEVGREDFDRAFLIDAAPAATLEQLVTDRVQKAALTLLDRVQALTIDRHGATFTQPAEPEADPAPLVADSLELGQAITAAFAEGRGAYR